MNPGATGKRPGRPKGLPKYGGRKKGTPNKATAEVRAIAGKYGPKAIERLAWIMENGENHQVQVAACRELLDRAYGKPPQAITGGGEDASPLVFKMVF